MDFPTKLFLPLQSGTGPVSFLPYREKTEADPKNRRDAGYLEM